MERIKEIDLKTFKGEIYKEANGDTYKVSYAPLKGNDLKRVLNRRIALLKLRAELMKELDETQGVTNDNQVKINELAAEKLIDENDLVVGMVREIKVNGDVVDVAPEDLDVELVELIGDNVFPKVGR